MDVLKYQILKIILDLQNKNGWEGFLNNEPNWTSLLQYIWKDVTGMGLHDLFKISNLSNSTGISPFLKEILEWILKMPKYNY